MRVLLDSNVIFWFMLDAPQLSARAAGMIADPANRCLISPVNHWEMALKLSVEKFELALTGEFEDMWRDVTARFAVLPIEPRHSARMIDLPWHHKDPFDRMLAAQALAEDIPLLSSDRKLDAYGVRRIW